MQGAGVIPAPADMDDPFGRRQGAVSGGVAGEFVDRQRHGLGGVGAEGKCRARGPNSRGLGVQMGGQLQRHELPEVNTHPLRAGDHAVGAAERMDASFEDLLEVIDRRSLSQAQGRLHDGEKVVGPMIDLMAKLLQPLLALLASTDVDQQIDRADQASVGVMQGVG